jgi:type IV pilus assembly protein PilW
MLELKVPMDAVNHAYRSGRASFPAKKGNASCPGRSVYKGSGMKKDAGFTLVELMVTAAVAIIVLAAVFNLFIKTNEMYTVQDKIVQVQQNIRGAMELMTNDIRMAGLDPNGTAPNAGVAFANSTSIHVLMDYNGNGTCGRDMDFRFDPNDDQVDVARNGGTYQALADDIDSVTLQYALEDGSITGNPSAAEYGDIETVTLSICGQISGSYSDQYDSEYCFNNTVSCRNL